MEPGFDSCWKCAPVENPPDAGPFRPAAARTPLFFRWARGWLVLLFVVCVGFLASAGSWILSVLNKVHPMLVFALGGVFFLVVLPVVAHGLFIQIFGEEAWPSQGSAPDEEELAFAQLEQATRLEVRGNVSGALAAYQRVIDEHGGTEAAADAQRSLAALRKKTA
jgi:hypothetical protein